MRVVRCVRHAHWLLVRTSESLPSHLAGNTLKVISLCVCQGSSPRQHRAVTQDHLQCSLHVPNFLSTGRLRRRKKRRRKKRRRRRRRRRSEEEEEEEEEEERGGGRRGGGGGARRKKCP